jgi:hypothetical protein
MEMGLGDLPKGTVIMIDPEAIKIAGNAPLNGMYVSTDFYDPKSTLPLVQRFEKDYHAWRNEDTDFYVANYYEIGIIIYEDIKAVIAKGGDPFVPQQLEDMIQSKKTFSSLYGKGQVNLLPTGGVVKDGAIFQYQDGNMNLIKTYTPPEVGSYKFVQ